MHYNIYRGLCYFSWIFPILKLEFYQIIMKHDYSLILDNQTMGHDQQIVNPYIAIICHSIYYTYCIRYSVWAYPVITVKFSLLSFCMNVSSRNVTVNEICHVLFFTESYMTPDILIRAFIAVGSTTSVTTKSLSIPLLLIDHFRILSTYCHPS